MYKLVNVCTCIITYQIHILLVSKLFTLIKCVILYMYIHRHPKWFLYVTKSQKVTVANCCELLQVLKRNLRVPLIVRFSQTITVQGRLSCTLQTVSVNINSSKGAAVSQYNILHINLCMMNKKIIHKLIEGTSK